MKFLSILLFFPLFSIIQVHANVRYVDLTYAFNNESVKWPGRTSSIDNEFEGYSPEGNWWASRKFCTSEHTATHIDAPYHAAKSGVTLDLIPLPDLLDVPGILIDIYDKVHIYKDGKLNIVENYALTREDILEWEGKYGMIPPRALVLLKTGWGARWPDEKLYRGTTKYTVEGAPDLNFPSFGESAAKFLVTERQIVGIGVDTLSVDVGNDKIAPVHVTLAARGKYMLEMVANLHLLPPRGFQLFAVPFKIDKGTGAPTRVLARFDR